VANANRVKERRLAAQAAAGVPSKRERRELGRKAAQQRMSARRRQILLRNGGGVLIIVALVGVIVLAMKLTGGSTPTASPTGSASTPAPITAPTDPALNTKPTVTKGTGKLAGLNVTTLVAGTGPVVESGETLTVNYVGVNYATGEEFDSSWKTGKPFVTPIGVGKVIKGWDQGLVGIKIGSRVQLDIPADLAYGTSGSGPTTGDLRFVVDILSATPPAAG
jgi:FKBP-type peptidyl-prolyl cis-trans isomerase